MLVVYTQIEPRSQTTTIIVIAILVVIAGLAKGLADRLAHHPNTLPGWMQNSKFWGRDSWKNKWKDDLKTEKFWGSSRWFVFLTDGWHMANAIYLASMSIAIVYALKLKGWLKNAIAYIAARILIYLGFTITYK